MKRGGLLFIFILFILQTLLPAAAAEQPERAWQDESIYYVVIDRFHNGSQKNDYEIDMNDPEAFHGGDFQGIIDQLDYIEGMGFTVIALSPIFASENYHGFAVNDFYKTEEHFGTVEEFKTLVAEVHKRDMKVILDFDVYHLGAEHPWLNEADKEDWVRAGEAGEGPVFNLDNPEVKEYLIEAAKWWITETGIDGYRLLSVQNAPEHFWHDFTAEIRKSKPDFYLLGDSKLPSHEGDKLFSGTMNKTQNLELRKIFVRPDLSFQPLFVSLEQMEEEEAASMVNFMDDVHIVRFTNGIIQQNEHPGPRWKQALTFLYTAPGVPFMYYGSEIALDGGEGAKNHGQMNFRTDKDLYEYIAKIGELRKQLPSLTRGNFTLLYEKDGAAIFKREYENETTVIALNNTTKTQTITLTADMLDDDKELRGMLNGDLVRSADGEYVITIDRDMAEVYLLSEKSSINISYIIAMLSVLIAFTIFMILVWRKSKAMQKNE